MTERVAALLYRRRHRAFAACFLTPEGTPTPAGRTVLNFLKTICEDPNPASLVDKEGRVDPNAVMISIGSRNIWRIMCRYLYLDERTIQGLNETAGMKDDDE